MRCAQLGSNTIICGITIAILIRVIRVIRGCLFLPPKVGVPAVLLTFPGRNDGRDRIQK